MVLNLLDKLVFGVSLLLALQIPLLADHYQQFLAGYYQATKVQVDGYKAVAARHQYNDVQSMIDEHLNNISASVRADAEQKLKTLQEFKSVEQSIEVFNSSNIINKTIHMFNPNRTATLTKTLEHFKPGIPITLDGLVFGVITGLVLNLFFTLPIYLIFRRKKALKRRAFG